MKVEWKIRTVLDNNEQAPTLNKQALLERFKQQMTILYQDGKSGIKTNDRSRAAKSYEKKRMSKSSKNIEKMT